MPSTSEAEVIQIRDVKTDTVVTVSGTKDPLNDFLWDETQGIVQTGPFKDMQLIKEESWKDGNSGNKCLGCYEQELHIPLEEDIPKLALLDNPKIVNVGCAEGYYAVGLAMRLPKASIYIIDIDEKALELSKRAAAANNVTLIDKAPLDDVMNGADLMICDCEGAEVFYLDNSKFDFTKTTIFVECHDWLAEDTPGLPPRPTAEILLHRFGETHHVFICPAETVRAPNNYEPLRKLPSHAKWLAVSEGRPCLQDFLVMRPK